MLHPKTAETDSQTTVFRVVGTETRATGLQRACWTLDVMKICQTEASNLKAVQRPLAQLPQRIKKKRREIKAKTCNILFHEVWTNFTCDEWHISVHHFGFFCTNLAASES